MNEILKHSVKHRFKFSSQYFISVSFCFPSEMNEILKCLVFCNYMTFRLLNISSVVNYICILTQAEILLSLSFAIGHEWRQHNTCLATFTITPESFIANSKIVYIHLIIIKLYTASFKHQYNKGTLPENLNNFFTSVHSKHQYSIRLASKSTFSLPSARTNYVLTISGTPEPSVCKFKFIFNIL